MVLAQRQRKRGWYFGKIDKGTKSDTIQDFLKEKYSRDFTVEALPVRDDALSISFKLGADLDLLKQLEDSANWPRGVIIKRFSFFRRQTGKFQ